MYYPIIQALLINYLLLAINICSKLYILVANGQVEDVTLYIVSRVAVVQLITVEQCEE